MLLHYSIVRDKIFGIESREGNTQFLTFSKDTINFKKTKILSIKKFLKKKGIKVRI